MNHFKSNDRPKLRLFSDKEFKSFNIGLNRLHHFKQLHHPTYLAEQRKNMADHFSEFRKLRNCLGTSLFTHVNRSRQDRQMLKVKVFNEIVLRFNRNF